MRLADGLGLQVALLDDSPQKVGSHTIFHIRRSLLLYRIFYKRELLFAIFIHLYILS